MLKLIKQLSILQTERQYKVEAFPITDEDMAADPNCFENVLQQVKLRMGNVDFANTLAERLEQRRAPAVRREGSGFLIRLLIGLR